MEDFTKISETDFELKVINHLTKIGGVRQWEYRPDIKTTDQMWNNLKEIIERNNRNKINGNLSDTEFSQVKREISRLDTPYKAGQFLYGMNGISEIDITLDDGKQVFLNIFEKSKTGGGQNSYQVVNQIQVPRKIEGKQDRRFDVTLLINGLPIIQIELKKATNSTQEALNQMHQYIVENQYSDIYSTIQILIAMTPNDIRYMANTTKDKFNKDFAFQWQDEENSNPIRNWKVFSDLFLSIPMAHDMATNYMILDGTKNKESIKVMRPYQVYATRRVLDAVRKHDFSYTDGKLGYVWHTTGSGKTITSFKTAWLASRLPNVDKVIFLVDRIALTRQTADAYKAYDPYSTYDGNEGSIADTKNISDLHKKFTKKSDKNIIVTSIQKMSRYVNSKSFKEINENILFIVDEAHRSTGTGLENQGMLEDIRKKLPLAGWIGYTGTPRFPETKIIFGSPLHVYTIKEAIADKNVLGFNVHFKETIKAPQNPTDEDIDDNIKSSIYDENKDHLRLVVEDIFDNWKKRSVNFKYNALFTVHVGGNKPSTPRAMEYYDEFQRQNSLRKPEERLKVAVSFSLDTSNGENMIENNESLTRAIHEYNQTFGTTFDLSTTKEYTEDITRRLNKSIDDEKYLDLVIVVDQLLTGFDAPGLNTLYVDRTLKGANLMQAYSRTNRIHDSVNKPWGNVINYRWPKQNEQAMNEAFALYSNRLKASEQLSFKDYEKMNIKDEIIAKPFIDVKEEMKELIEEISNLTEDFVRIPRSEIEQEVLLHDINRYSRLVGKLKQYTEDENGEPIDAYEKADEFYKKIGITQEQEVTLTTVLANELKRIVSKRKQIDISEIELELNHIHDVKINYDYLTELISKMADQVNEDNMKDAEKTKIEIEGELEKINDEVQKSWFKKFINGIFTKKHKLSKYPATTSTDELHEEIQAYHVITDTKKITDFIDYWGLNNSVMPKDLEELFSKHRVKEDDLDKQGELNNILLSAKDEYPKFAAKEISSLKWIHYRKELRKAIYELADEIVGGSYD